MKLLILAAATCIAIAGHASATTVETFTGSTTDTNGNVLSAQVDFTIVNGNLQIILTNNSTATYLPNEQPQDLLEGLFFNDVTGGQSIALQSITLPIGTVFGFPLNTNPGTTLATDGSTWATASNFSVSGLSGKYDGIAAAGLGGLFSGPGGSDYGLLPNNSCLSGSCANGGLHGPLIKNSVVVTVAPPSGVTYSLSNINNVVFQYGTSTSEPEIIASTGTFHTTSVPEPASFAMFGTGLLALWVARRGRRAAR